MSKTKDSVIPSTASCKRIEKKVGGLYGGLFEILWCRYKKPGADERMGFVVNGCIRQKLQAKK
jgi:hypothetical protein